MSRRCTRIVTIAASMPVALVASLLAVVAVAPPAMGAQAFWPEPTELVSLTSSGTLANRGSGRPSISASGRYVAFHSAATNLASDTNQRHDVFVRDRDTGITERVSISSGGGQGNGHSTDPDISDDGRFVAFESTASTLVSGDTNASFSDWANDVFVHDRDTDVTERVSVATGGAQTQLNADSFDASISGDGRYVAFVSTAANLAPNDTNSTWDVFVRDRQAGTTTRVSVAPDGSGANNASLSPWISSDGRYVAFGSSASNLVAGDTNGVSDAFVRDLQTGVTERVSLSTSGAQANAAAGVPSISDDGRYVAFRALASNLAAGDANVQYDHFVRDRQAGTTERVSVATDGTEGDDDAGFGGPSISGDGRHVAFESFASNLVTDGNDTVGPDLFAHDRLTHVTERISVSSSGAAGNSSSYEPSLTADGRLAAFESGSGNLVLGDTNNEFDVFVRDRLWVPPPVTEAQARGQGGHGARTTVRRSDPVDTATGAFVEQVTDLAVPAAGVPFSFSRTYNSNDPMVGPLGKGWSHNLGASITLDPLTGDATVRTEDGAELLYEANGTGGFFEPFGITSTLAAVTGGHELTRRDLVRYRFDTAGRLVSVKDRNGLGLDLAYDAGGRLQTATDAAARAFTFTYDAAGKLATVATPAADGRDVSFGYTGDLLTSSTDVRNEVTAYDYDAAGRLTKITDPEGRFQVRNTYGADGRVVEQLDPLGNPTTFDWDAATGTSTVTDARGATWVDVYSDNVLLRTIDPAGTAKVGWDSRLNPTRYTDPRGNVWSLTYDTRGNLLSRAAPAPFTHTERWTYDTANNPLTYKDGRGNTTTYTYDAAGRLSTTTYPAGSGTETRTYNAAGQLATVVDPRNNTTTYDYDPAGNLVSITTPEGNVTSWTYDAAGRPLTRTEPRGNAPGGNTADHTSSWAYDEAGNVLTHTDRLGRVTTFTYDGNGRMLTRTDPADRTTAYTYNDVGELASVTAPGGLVTSYEYDSRGQLVKVTTPTGAITTYAYDDAGRLLSAVEPRGNVPDGEPADYQWAYAHDAAGNQTSVTNPLGDVTSRSYDTMNRIASVTDANGHKTTFGYDANSNRTTVTDPLNKVTTWTFDVRNRPTGVKNPLNKTWTYGYDGNGNVTSEVTPLGATTTHAYDTDNRLVTSVDPLGNAAGGVPTDHDTILTYDEDGNLLTRTDPLGATTAHAYDRAGNRTSTTDANLHVTTWTYDALDRLTGVSRPASGTTAYGYDTAGNLVTRTDANNHTTTYGYDAGRRLVSLTTPTGQRWTYGYDVAGNRTTTVDAKANALGVPQLGTTTATYDAAGRLTGVDHSDATPDVTYLYDAVGNRTTMIDGAGVELRTYDAADRLTSVMRNADAFDYTYDASGRLTSRTYPDGSVSTLGYDDSNRLVSVVAPEGTTSYTYDAAGRPDTTTLPNGVVETRTFDAASRLSTLTATKAAATLASFSYSRDPVGNPLQAVASTGTQSYAYDASDRLTSVCHGPSACAAGSADLTAWTYDLVGNRLTETTGGSTRTYTYDADDKLLSSAGPGGTGATTYAYDANGNQTAAGLETYSYDMARRMTAAVLPAVGGVTRSYAYVYDGDGRRTATTASNVLGATTLDSTVTSTSWDVSHAVPEVAYERDVPGSGNAPTATRRYGYGLDRISTTAGASTGFYVHDGMGSVAGVTSPLGLPQWTYSYEPFGASRTAVHNDATAAAQPMRYTGEQLDASGLYHLRARQYDTRTGRFTATDPLAPQIDDPYVSAYVYTDDRPTVLVDPTGEKGRYVGPVGGFQTPARTAPTAPPVPRGPVTLDPVVPPEVLPAGGGGGGLAGAGPLGAAVVAGVVLGGVIVAVNPFNYREPVEEFAGDMYDKATKTDEWQRRSIYRGLFDKKGKPQVNPGAFRYDFDGVSFFELPGLPRMFSYKLEARILTGTKTAATGIFEDPLLAGCAAAHTPTDDGNIYHWSVTCAGGKDVTQGTLSTYARARPDMITPR